MTYVPLTPHEAPWHATALAGPSHLGPLDAPLVGGAGALAVREQLGRIEPFDAGSPEGAFGERAAVLTWIGAGVFGNPQWDIRDALHCAAADAEAGRGGARRAIEGSALVVR
ncbi:hypothetical protein [Pendulispora albinea]|uniref:Uncharacterized protein n=1 Tax=Pendulispora albinea TaxID=2741071 RepID=A0ABZ2M446_9BACT